MSRRSLSRSTWAVRTIFPTTMRSEAAISEWRLGGSSLTAPRSRPDSMTIPARATRRTRPVYSKVRGTGAFSARHESLGGCFPRSGGSQWIGPFSSVFGRFAQGSTAVSGGPMSFTRIVAASFLTLSILAPSIASAEPETGLVSADSVQVRVDPNPKAKSPWRISHGRLVSVLDHTPDGKWVKIKGEYPKGDDIVKFEGWLETKYVRSRGRY